MIIEACVFSVEEAVRAQNAGAHRIELNSDKAGGGCTPSYGTTAWITRNLTIKAAPIIRPRVGGFVYTDREFEVMKEDARMAVSLGADSIVTGILTAESELDSKRMLEMVKICGNTPVACHLAYERVAPEKKGEAFERLIDIGVKRLLYAGRPKSYDDALRNLESMMNRANGRIEIMTCDMDIVPWSKMPEFIKKTGVTQYHMWDMCSKYDLGTYARTLDNADLQEMADEAKMAAKVSLLMKCAG